jgi:hypothetical protein
MRKVAFTLAEMMVVLLVLSIAIAAFAPMMTQRSRQSGGGGDLWQKTTGGIYYNIGSAESVMIGLNTKPADTASLVIKKNGASNVNIILMNDTGTNTAKINYDGTNVIVTGANVTVPTLTATTLQLGNSSLTESQLNFIKTTIPNMPTN